MTADLNPRCAFSLSAMPLATQAKIKADKLYAAYGYGATPPYREERGGRPRRAASHQVEGADGQDDEGAGWHHDCEESVLRFTSRGTVVPVQQ